MTSPRDSNDTTSRYIRGLLYHEVLSFEEISLRSKNQWYVGKISKKISKVIKHCRNWLEINVTYLSWYLTEQLESASLISSQLQRCLITNWYPFGDFSDIAIVYTAEVPSEYCWPRSAFISQRSFPFGRLSMFTKKVPVKWHSSAHQALTDRKFVR